MRAACLTEARRTREFRRRFNVGGVLYEFSAINGGPVTFGTIGGGTSLKAFSGSIWGAWDDENAQFIEGGYFRNGFPVLRSVISLTTEWIRSERPFRFHFEAVSDRKHRIYRYLVARYQAPAIGHYVHYMEGDRFWFVRTDERP